jgi:rfaE bifunctional protein kinase chain/domain
VNVQGILAQFPAMRALVVGDVCLDRWCTYDPALSEPSRETGILRVAVTASENTPGAAGTVASNLAALGVGRVAVLGVIGNDGFGLELERALAERSIATELLIRSSLVSTFTYTKLLNSLTGIEDLPRLDFINAQPLNRALESQLVDSLREKIHDFDVILVSDQAETATGGVVTAAVRDALGKIEDKLVWVDSRARAELFRNVILKINREEADAACKRIGMNLQGLREHTGSKLLIVTRGADGATVVGESAGANYETNPPARRVEHPVDICGAGDSFSAGAAMALAVTGSPTEAVEFGHLVASHTIMKKGTGTVTPAELLAK